MKMITWDSFPLPLIQVNPPDLQSTNEIVEIAYQNGVFSNNAEIHHNASRILARHVNENFSGYLANNNTLALVACLLRIGVRGKHVLISNFTFAATLDAVILAGGIPVVCDVDTETLHISFESVGKILESPKFNIGAVVPTRVFGFINDLSTLTELCKKYKVPVVIDSAACFPAKPNSWKFKTHSLYEVFSFHATKVFGIGEGGLIVGEPEEIKSVRKYANFGIDPEVPGKFFDGINAKADEFTSSRALARLNGYAADVVKRRLFVEMYKEIFKYEDSICIIRDTPETIYSYFPIIFSKESELQQFQNFIQSYVITRRYYFPTIFGGYRGDAEIQFDTSLQNSESIASRILCLPVYVSCSFTAKERIKDLFTEALKSLR